MKIIIQAIDKAVRAGVYTLEETSIILKELEALGSIVESAVDGPKESSEEIKSEKNKK